MSKDEAVKSIRQGAIVAGLVSAWTFIAACIGYFGDFSDGIFGYVNDQFIILDIVLLLLFTFGTYKRSRFATIGLVIYWLLAKLVMAFDGFSGGFFGLAISLIIFWFFAKAAYGAIVFNRIERDENPNYKKPSKVWYFVGIPIGVIASVVTSIGIASIVGYLPDTAIQSGDEVSEAGYNSLINAQIISKNDRVKFIYEDGFFWAESGQLLTQDALVIYYTDEGDALQVFALPYESITGVELEQAGDDWSDSVYSVETLDYLWRILLSTEDGGNDRFISELNRLIDAK